MNRIIITLIGILFVLLFSTCGKVKLNPNQFYISDFPISLNNYWEYERLDSQTMMVDTIRLHVTEKNVSVGGEKGLWKLIWQNAAGVTYDSNYVKVHSGTITFYNYDFFTDFLRIESQYEFPFKVNTEWDAGIWRGMYTVLSDETVCGDSQQDSGEAYLLQRDIALDLGESINEQIIMAKGIGICRRYVKKFGYSYVVLQLIDYHLE